MQTNNASQPIAALAPPKIAASEVVLGRLVGLDDSNRPLVSFALGEFRAEAIVALSTQALQRQDIGRELALLFAGGDAQSPVIMGLIHSPLSEVLMATLNAPVHSDAADIAESSQAHLTASTETRIDGKRLVFEAEDEVVIRCGESAIILTKNGQVTIRGKYVLTRASGVNRILGGSVQVN